MHRHKYFDLLLHDDDELEGLLRSRVVERTTLHQWPLSCVQRVVTADGHRFAYKSQSGPSVEPEFYASARSSLLVPARTVHQADGYSCMLLDLVEGSLIRDLKLGEAEVVRIGLAVQAQIARIEGDLPCCVDVGTEPRWCELARATLTDLRTLIAQGRMRLVTEEVVGVLEGWAFDPSTLAAIRRKPGYIHGDLHGSNLFVVPDGYRLVDWASTKIAPVEVDLATLVDSLGLDPWQHVSAGAVRVMWLLRVQWFTQCAMHWFPAGTPDYDLAIPRLASLMAGPDIK